MGRRGPEGCITAARIKGMEEKSWKQGRVEARFEGGQGPEGAVAPYMDGWILLVWNFLAQNEYCVIVGVT
jgi:hypothetical protein